jgi:hypothetical protein
MTNKAPVELFGVVLTKKQYPHLSRWAETDIEGLQQTIKDLDRQLGGDSDPVSTMITLENDLRHG